MRLSRVFIFLIICLSFFIFGCATHDLKPISAKNRAEQLLSRNLNESGFLEFVRKNQNAGLGLSGKAWSLDRLTLAAFYFHPDMELARAQNQLARAGIAKARERANPTLSFTPEGITNPGVGLSPWIQSFNLNIPLETGGKRRARLKQAGALNLAENYNFVTTAWLVRSRLASAFFHVYLAGKKVSLLKAQQTLLESFLGALRERARSGMNSPRDVTDLEIVFDQTKLDLTDAQNRQDLARADLAAAIGLPLATIKTLSLDFSIFTKLPIFNSTNKQTLQMLALTNRSDILSGVADYAGCLANLEQELAKRYPDLNLGPGYQWSQGEHHWSLGFSLTLPLLNFNRGAVAQANAQCAASMARFNQLQVGIVANLDHTLLDFMGASQREQLLKIKWQHEQLRVEQIRGTGASEEAVRHSLVLAQINRQATELAYFDSLDVTYKALFDLENILQRPLLGYAKIMGAL